MTTIEELYQFYLESSGVSKDTRTIKSGKLYFALKGPNFDGNVHASTALKKGAFKVIVDNPDVVENESYVLVDNALFTLQNLAKFRREQLNHPILGITGSNGKTTTKELICSVLSSRFKVSATQGNYNNHIGVPLTILNADRTAEILIVEMGANQPSDIKLLCDIAGPSLGVITNIGAAHLERLGSKDGVFEEKTELFRSVEQMGGVIFLNTSDQYLSRYHSELAQVIEFKQEGYGGIHSRIKNDQSPLLSMVMTAGIEEYELGSNLVGDYNSININAALCIGDFFGIDLISGIQAVADYRPVNMRSQFMNTERNTLTVDAYNANPSSMKESINAFLKNDAKAHVLILGDMLELGEEEDELHIDILNLPVIQQAREVVLIGKIFSSVGEGYLNFTTVQELIDSTLLEKINNSNILIKGSRGIQLERVIPYL